MKNKLILAAILLSLISVTSCKKEPAITGKGSVTIHFDNRAGASDFAFSTNYTTALGETVNFSTFKYYVSNFVLVKGDGSTYVIPQNETYHLIDESVDSSTEITFDNIPAGDYNSLKYIIGVDSLRSTTDVSQRTGDLDPAGVGADMYWSWNSGYIFFKIEGTSPQSTEMGNMFMYHIGGYGGYSSSITNNIRNVSISSAEAIQVRESKNPEVHVYADVLQAFTSPVNYSIASGAIIHMPDMGATIANNYADMFKIDHIHND